MSDIWTTRGHVTVVRMLQLEAVTNRVQIADHGYQRAPGQRSEKNGLVPLLRGLRDAIARSVTWIATDSSVCIAERELG